MRVTLLGFILISAVAQADTSGDYRACVLKQFKESLKQNACEADGRLIFQKFAFSRTAPDCIEILMQFDLSDEKSAGMAQELVAIDANNWVKSQREGCGKQACNVLASSCSTQSLDINGQPASRSTVGSVTR